MESAEYEIRLRDAFSSGLGKLESKMNHFESKVGGLGSTMAAVFGGVTLAGAISTGISLIGDLAKSVVSLGADMEQTRISFTTMLGGAEKANQVIGELQNFAKATPFSQKEVVAGAKSLLAYGFEAQNLTKDLTTLGDVSAGLSIPIGDLIYLYGTLKTQGKAMSKDLMQFAGRGIPIYKELGKVLGVDTSKVSDLVSEGKVGFAEVEKAFQNMTGAGSMFGGLMEKQSQTLSGRWSTFKDTLEIIGTSLGTKLLPFLGKVVDGMSYVASLIPRLDFSLISDSFEDIYNIVSELFSVWNDLFGGMFEGISTLNILQGVINATIFPLKNFSFAVSFVYEWYKTLIKAVKDSAVIWQGIGDIIAGVFTFDTTKIFGGINRVKIGFADMTRHAADEWGSFAKKQAESYAKLFNFSGKPEDKSKGVTGAGDSKGTGMAGAGLEQGKAIGVEKIQAGTRNVVVNINKLVENVNINKTLERAGNSELVESIKRALLTAVNDVNIAGQ